MDVSENLYIYVFWNVEFDYDNHFDLTNTFHDISCFTYFVVVSCPNIDKNTYIRMYQSTKYSGFCSY